MAYEGKARSLILKLKHSDRTDLARPAAHWLADRLSGKLDPKTLVVPVPIHPVRLLHRRYNQAALIARGVARQLDLPLEVNALLRKKATQTLDDLTVVERFAILAGAISANPKVDFTGAKVVVIDDVMTSGATLSAAADALYRAGAQDVCVAVLARVLKAP
ncbi:MAG: ComF family protein [Pseudomonadota bacterium]